MQRAIAFVLLVLLALVGVSRGQSPAISPETGPAATGPTTRTSGRAVVLPIEGEINEFTAGQFKRRVEEARKQGADTIVVRLDTPGGLVSAAMDIVDTLKTAGKDMRTAAYVQKHAYSAGALIAVACHEIAMAPDAIIGDCAPIIVGQGGLENVTGANRAKIESPLVQTFEDLAERHGYDPLLVRAFVQYQVTVYVIEKPGEPRRFVTPEQWQQLKEEGWRLSDDIKNPVDDELTLLTVNDTTARKLRISRGTFDTLEDYARHMGVTIDQTFETSAGESIVEWLSSSGVRGLLGLVFMLSIYFVFSKPGTGLAESAAIVSGVVLFGVPMLTGYAGWLEILLILIGLILVAMEIFVIPGFGVTGITGVLLLLAGLVLTYVPSEAPALPDGDGGFFPQLPQTQAALKEGLIISAVGLLVSLGLWWWLSKYITKVPYVNRLVLQTSVGQTVEPGHDAARDLAEQAWPAIGARGTAITDLKPGGVARFYDTIVNDERNIDVVSDHGYVSAGRAVVVRHKEGNRIVVRQIEPGGNT